MYVFVYNECAVAVHLVAFILCCRRREWFVFVVNNFLIPAEYNIKELENAIKCRILNV
jgi:hypothetical protein